MLVKIVVVFCITKYVHGQMNGQFWWMNNKVSQYYNKFIPPPRIEDLPSYETDDSVKITFRDSEFDQYNRFRDRRKNVGFMNPQPNYDYNQYPGERNTYPDYQPRPTNNFIYPGPRRDERRFFANERMNGGNWGNTLGSKNVREYIPTQRYEETTTVKQITPSIPSPETRAPFASFDDYINFVTGDQKQENTEIDDLCTYITETECGRRRGIVYNLNGGRNRNGPYDPNLICCTLIPKPVIVPSTTIPTKVIPETTTESLKITTYNTVDKVISHDVSDPKNTDQKTNLNLDAQIQSICKYLTEEKCHSYNGLINYVISKRYPKYDTSNRQLVCCIVLPNLNVIENTSKSTVHITENNTEPPKSITKSREFNENVSFLSNVDDYISKFGVVKNTTNSNLLGKNYGKDTLNTNLPTLPVQESKPPKAVNDVSNIKPAFTNDLDYVSIFGEVENTTDPSIHRQNEEKIIPGTTTRPTATSQENITKPPKNFNLDLFNVNDYISKFGVIKNDSNLEGQKHRETVLINKTDSILSNLNIDNYITKFSFTINNKSQQNANDTKTFPKSDKPIDEEVITEKSPNKSKNHEKVRTTAIPFRFPDKSYIDSYNNPLSVNIIETDDDKQKLNKSTLEINKSKKLEVSLMKEPKIDSLISKYGVNTDDLEQVEPEKNKIESDTTSTNNHSVFKTIETTTIPNTHNMKNCTFITNSKCLNLRGTINQHSIRNPIANDQQIICCILPLQTESYSGKSTKESDKVKVSNKNLSAENKTDEGKVVFFPISTLVKYPKITTEKPSTTVKPIINDYINEKSDTQANSKSICTYIKEHECKQRRGFVYGIQFGKSMSKGPPDPELVCCILLESEDNTAQRKVVSRTNKQMVSPPTEKSFSNVQLKSETYEKMYNAPFVFPSQTKKNEAVIQNNNKTHSKLEFEDNRRRSTSSFMNNDRIVEHSTNKIKPPFDANAKRRDTTFSFPDDSNYNYRFKRSTDDDASPAQKQRTVLLKRRFTTQTPKPDFTHIRIVTQDYDEDPYWNVKNHNFHKPQTPNKNKCNFKPNDYVDELPRPGLTGLYSDHGSRPSYDAEYDYDDSDYEDSGISIGYSTLNPRFDSNKRKVKLQTKPPKSTTRTTEKYDPEKQIVTFQSNPDFHVFDNFKLLNVVRHKTKFPLNSNDESEESVLTKPIPESSEEYDGLQLFEDCGARMIRTNFPATKQSGDTQYRSHPWLALVVPTNQQHKILCYATIIHPKAAMTTADCVYEKTPGEVTLIAGIWDLNQRSRSRTRVPTIHINKDYLDDNLDNNLSILTWTQPLKLGVNIQPACLSDMNSEEDCMVFGWNGLDQAVRSRSKWQRVTINDCDDLQDSSEQEMPSTAFCGKVQSRSVVSGKGGPLICTKDGRQSLAGVIISTHRNSLVLLPARTWGLQAGSFIHED